MDFEVVKICSRCNYYMQNHALNAQALKLPHSELSSMWQCTGSHILGDLYYHDSHKTPYRPVATMRYNAFIISIPIRTSDSNSDIGKWVRLFKDDTPQLGGQDTPSPAPSLPLLTSVQAALSERYKCQ
jgi:hypothetical protein